MINLSEFAANLESLQRAHRLKKHSRMWQPRSTSATAIGYKCERRIVYGRVMHDKAAPIEAELASIFEEGDLHGKNVRAELLELGFEVVAAEVNFRDDRLDLSGTIDGKIRVPDPDAPKGFRDIPAEIKSFTGEAPHSLADWLSSENLRMRRYYDQLELYLYLTNEPDGLGLFKDKITGLWSVIAVPLDYAHVETLLQRAARVRDAVGLIEAAKESAENFDALLPERIANRSECDGCPFKDTVCHPADAAVDPMLLALDDELIEQLEQRDALDEGRKKFKKLDDAVKERFKLTKGERFVAGPFKVEKKKHGSGIRIDIERLQQP